MKKFLVLLLALCLPLTAMAEEVTANGVVESRVVTQLTAPFSGVILPFDWENGDRVKAEDSLFQFETVKLYAPVDGTVHALFAEEGDQTADVIARYGMLASIEKENPLIVDASTSGAYNEPENRRVHAGETLYFEQSNDRDNEGEGRVISVSGDDYVIELLKGDFEDGDSVKIYRDEKMGTKSCVGSGKIEWAEDVSVTGSGFVLRAAVREGDSVRKGDLLYELLAQDADSSVLTADVRAREDGALELAVSSGTQVYKGQLLGKVHNLKELSVIASVDEMDLDCVREGDSLTIVFDRYPNEMVMGTVSTIGAIGVPRQNAAYYDVTVDFYTTLEVLPGMNATVYLQKAQ